MTSSMLHNGGMASSNMSGAGGRWRLGAKHFFNQRGAQVTALDFHRETGMLVVGFSNGIFDLFEVRHMLATTLAHISQCSMLTS